MSKMKCPNCEQGDIFKKKAFFSFNKMHEHCAVCDHKFEKEPGFFFGAMYVSYALNVAELVAALVLMQFFFEDMFAVGMVPIVVSMILLLAPINFMYSRVIWMYFFTTKKETPTAETVE